VPKLDSVRLGRNRATIEKAALACFLRYGYHGVSIRQIADAAKTSIGNLYNYYPDKLSIYQAVFDGLATEFLTGDDPVRRYIARGVFPSDLPALARAVATNVDEHTSYFKMTYIDVVEFNGAHASRVFSDVYDKFAALLQPRLRRQPSGRRVDPVFAFVAIYLQFYYFFALKALFGARHVYGKIPDDEVVAHLIELYLPGLRARRPRAKASAKRPRR
jgi:AcrR family transcriptional regulator